MKRALLLGISEYDVLAKAPTSVKDVEGIAGVLRHPDMGGFDLDAVKIVHNPNSQEMREEIEKLFLDPEIKKDDLLLLYFSGHGIIDSDRQLYLASSNTQPTKLLSTAIPSSSIHQLMNRTRSWKQVIILDCCFSGAFAQELIPKGDVVILTSSGMMSYSHLGEDLSIYTYYLIQGIKQGAAAQNQDGWILSGALHKYAQKKVREKVPEMKPEIHSFREGFEIQIAKAFIDDPHFKYRRTVKECIRSSKGKISAIDREELKVRQSHLKLSDREADLIENEVSLEYQEYHKNLSQYKQSYRQARRRGIHSTEDTCRRLKELQQILSLTDEDIEKIEKQEVTHLWTHTLQPSVNFIHSFWVGLNNAYKNTLTKLSNINFQGSEKEQTLLLPNQLSNSKDSSEISKENSLKSLVFDKNSLKTNEEIQLNKKFRRKFLLPTFLLLITLSFCLEAGIVFWQRYSIDKAKNLIQNTCQNINLHTDLTEQMNKLNEATIFVENIAKLPDILIAQEIKIDISTQVVVCSKYIELLKSWQEDKIKNTENKIDDLKYTDPNKAVEVLSKTEEKAKYLINYVEKESDKISKIGIDVQIQLKYLKSELKLLSNIILFQTARNKATLAYKNMWPDDPKNKKNPPAPILQESINILDESIKLLNAISKDSALYDNAQNKISEWSQSQKFWQAMFNEENEILYFLQETTRLYKEAKVIITTSKDVNKLEKIEKELQSAIGKIDKINTKKNNFTDKLNNLKQKSINITKIIPLWSLINEFSNFVDNSLGKIINHSIAFDSYYNELSILDEKLNTLKNQLDFSDLISKLENIYDKSNRVYQLWYLCSQRKESDFCLTSQSTVSTDWNYLTNILGITPKPRQGFNFFNEQYIEFNDVVKVITEVNKEEIKRISKKIREVAEELPD